MENEVKDLEIQYEISKEEIKRLIYTIRGKQVMIDNDVAKLYHYTTKNINKAVKRNIERFPEEFCFQLTENEFQTLRFQIGTSKQNESQNLRFQIETSKQSSEINNNLRGGRRYLPYVFTEQGIAMLAGVLKNDIAVKVSLNIINSFIEMRKFIASNGQVFERLTNMEYKLLEHDKKFDIVFDQLQQEENIKQKIFFEGQIYDAYSLIIDIIKKANGKITIIDNYIDDSILKMLAKKNKNVEVTILTSIKSNIQNIDIQKFNKEYPTLKVAITDKFHDRFVLLDNTEMYHLGASIKDLGKKCFAISKVENEEMINLIKKVI